MSIAPKVEDRIVLNVKVVFVRVVEVGELVISVAVIDALVALVAAANEGVPAIEVEILVFVFFEVMDDVVVNGLDLLVVNVEVYKVAVIIKIDDVDDVIVIVDVEVLNVAVVEVDEAVMLVIKLNPSVIDVVAISDVVVVVDMDIAVAVDLVVEKVDDVVSLVVEEDEVVDAVEVEVVVDFAVLVLKMVSLMVVIDFKFEDVVAVVDVVVVEVIDA